jgi:hypothetical protein
MKISLKILKMKQMGPLCRGIATTGKISRTRVAGGEGRGWERQEGTEPTCLWLWVGKWWTSVARRRGTEPAAVAGGGGGTPVRKRARGSVVQLRCEAEKVMGGLVWAIWGQSGASTRGWRLAGVGLGRRAKGLGWGFYRREREDGGLGTSC